MTERLVLRTHPRAAQLVVRRARVFAALRAHLDADGFLEADVPALLPFAGSEPWLHPPRVRVAGFDGPLWLQTSPEMACKRLLCAGVTRLYSLGLAYRGGTEELSSHHQPQFTMLEWYREGRSLEALVHDVVALAAAAATALEVDAPVTSRVLSVAEACRRYAGVDATALLHGDARAFARDARAAGLLRCRDEDSTTHLLGRVLVERIEPALAREPGLTFLHGYPADQAALAELDDGDPPTALRLEAYLGGLELANGYVELRDPVRQRARWLADAAQREGDPIPVDVGLLAAMQSEGLPPSVGMAMGVDRLVMALTGASTLSDVLPLHLARDGTST